MPSPRKGGTVPVRRRRRKVTGVRVPVAPPVQSSEIAFTRHRGGSDSSWTDTTDTSLGSSSSGSYRGSSSPRSSSDSSGPESSSSPSTSTASISPRKSSSSSDGNSTEGSDEEDDGGDDVDGPSSLKRGRSWSRRGARNRGGSVLCRFCGKRGYGGMKMIFTCCHKAVEESLQNSTSGISSTCSQLDSSRGSISSLEMEVAEVVARAADDMIVEVGTPPVPDGCPSPELISAAHCRKYRWSPCSSESSDDSSSTLSEGNPSSGEDADVEGNTADAVPKGKGGPRLPLLSRGGHVAVQ